jgi:hypothetical protein
MRSEKHHAVFLDMVREELNAIIKETGLVGGALVYHPNRVRHPDTGLTGKDAKLLLTREAMCQGNMRDDSPAADLYAHIRKQKNPDWYYYFSPHFHAVTFGKIIDGHEFDEKYPGWHYINKGNAPNPGGLARYLFSHMAMFEDRHAVTWFGRLSSAVLGTEEIRTTEREVICDKTGLPWIITDSSRPEEIGRTWMEPFTEYDCFFRTGQKRKKKDPGAIIFPKSGKRSMAPHGVHERGILALARYCDEYGMM